MKRECNKCHRQVDVKDMVLAPRYKYGVRPECLACRAEYNANRRSLKLSKTHVYIPRPKRKVDPERLVCKITQDISILIKYGYARNEEEARKYAKW